MIPGLFVAYCPGGGFPQLPEVQARQTRYWRSMEWTNHYMVFWSLWDSLETTVWYSAWNNTGGARAGAICTCWPRDSATAQYGEDSFSCWAATISRINNLFAGQTCGWQRTVGPTNWTLPSGSDSAGQGTGQKKSYRDYQVLQAANNSSSKWSGWGQPVNLIHPSLIGNLHGGQRYLTW